MSGFGINKLLNQNSPSEAPKQLTQQEVAHKKMPTIFEGMSIEDALNAGWTIKDKNNNGLVELNELTTEQYIKYLEEHDDNYKNITDNKEKKQYTLENLLKNNFDEQAIIKFCNDNNINITEFLKKCNLSDKEKLNYKNLIKNYTDTSDVETNLINLYSSKTSISDITKTLNKDNNYPLDLSSNNKNRKRIQDLLTKIKERFNSANFNDKKELIKQLEQLTGISLKNIYGNKKGYDLNRVFSVIYSLAQKVTSLNDNESLNINGQNISGTENIIKGINSQIESIIKSSNKNNTVIDLVQSFSNICRESIIKGNKGDTDSALIESINVLTKQQQKYAWELKNKYNKLLESASPENKQKAAAILDPNINWKSFLNTKDYILKAISAIKILDNTFDEVKFVEKLQSKVETENTNTNKYLLKIYNDYKAIKDKLSILREKNDKTDDDIKLLEKYELIYKRYDTYIAQNKIKDSDLELLNNKDFLNLDEIEINDKAIEFLEHKNRRGEIKSNIVHYAIRKNKIDNDPKIQEMLKEVFSSVPEIKGKTREEALQILKSLKCDSKNNDRKDIIEKLIFAYETLSDENIAKIENWHEMITNGATDEELFNEINSLIEDIKANNPNIDNNDIATIISNYIISSCDEQYNEKIVYITDYILKNYNVEDLADTHYLRVTASQNENLTKAQASYFVNQAKNDKQINVQKLYMIGTQGESVMQEMSQWEDLDPELRIYMADLINNDYNHQYSDDFKNEVMHNLGYTDYNATGSSTNVSNSSNSSTTTGGTGNSSNSDEMYGPYDNVFIMGTIDAPNYSHTNNNNETTEQPTQIGLQTSDKSANTITNPITKNPILSDKISELVKNNNSKDITDALKTRKIEDHAITTTEAKVLATALWSGWTHGKGNLLDIFVLEMKCADIVTNIQGWEEGLPQAKDKTKKELNKIIKEDELLKNNYNSIDNLYKPHETK